MRDWEFLSPLCAAGPIPLPVLYYAAASLLGDLPSLFPASFSFRSQILLALVIAVRSSYLSCAFFCRSKLLLLFCIVDNRDGVLTQRRHHPVLFFGGSRRSSARISSLPRGTGRRRSPLPALRLAAGRACPAPPFDQSAVAATLVLCKTAVPVPFAPVLQKAPSFSHVNPIQFHFLQPLSLPIFLPAGPMPWELPGPSGDSLHPHAFQP